jgi:quinol monooxygenase YgiN
VSNGLLDGKVAVVTGASNGIGRANAIAFAIQGAIADLTGQPGSGPKLLEGVRNLRQVSIAEPGTMEFSVVSVDAEPPRLIIIEKFDDQDAYQAHEDNPEVLAIAGTLRGLLAGVDVKTGTLDVA